MITNGVPVSSRWIFTQTAEAKWGVGIPGTQAPLLTYETEGQAEVACDLLNYLEERLFKRLRDTII